MRRHWLGSTGHVRRRRRGVRKGGTGRRRRDRTRRYCHGKASFVAVCGGIVAGAGIGTFVVLLMTCRNGGVVVPFVTASFVVTVVVAAARSVHRQSP